MNVSPTQSNVQEALRSFLIAVLPSDVEVIVAQDNRVPEPAGHEFVVMTPIRIARLATNLDTYADVKFTASIAGTVMTVSAVQRGQLEVGATVFGTGIVAGTKIAALGTGTGGVGTYDVTQGQTLGSRTLSSGAEEIEQEAEFTVQMDFHSASVTRGGDMAQTVSTLMRDPFATQQFAEQDPNYGVSPLLADDARQMPFINEAQQYEWRWVVEARLQADQVVTVPMQFSDAATIEVTSVEATYPPA